jgi:hypothetical protein
MTLRVGDVFLPRPPPEVVEAVVGGVAVKVATFLALGTRADERREDERMDTTQASPTLPGQTDGGVAEAIDGGPQQSRLTAAGTDFPSDVAPVADGVARLEAGDRDGEPALRRGEQVALDDGGHRPRLRVHDASLKAS